MDQGEPPLDRWTAPCNLRLHAGGLKMRKWTAAVLGASLLVGSAGAQAADDPPKTVITNPDWLKKPTGDDLAKAWPAEATAKGVTKAAVVIKCTVNVGGHLEDCTTLKEDPVGLGFGTAAIKAISEAALMKPKMVGGQPVGDGQITIPVTFITPPPSTGATNPDWLRKPTLEWIWLTFPRKAASMGLSGHATIKCVVNLQGLLQACSVVDESPRGYGFGEAAIELAPTFLMTPATNNGQPVESEITVPVGFEIENGSVLRLPNALIIAPPAWAKAPSVAEIQGQIDKKVGDKFADGKVIFLCNLHKATGKMSDCMLANESRGMAQFRTVANTLVSKFEADPKSLAEIRAQLGPQQTDAKIIVPFAFPDMASPGWGKRYITHVQWAHPYDPPPAGQPTLPDEARKAGLKDGSAMVDCQIDANGVLSQCDVLSESTPGVGLGGLAKRIAEGWVANRWTEEGLPVDGARVRLPIKMISGHRPYVDSDPALAAKP